jgi:SAM-dependent methyltransferase
MSTAAVEYALACPICGAAALEVYLEDRDVALDASITGSSRQAVSPGRIMRCRVCLFGFRQMRSSPDVLAELYRCMDTVVYESEATGRDRTARRHLAIVERHAHRGRLLDVGCAGGLFLHHALRAGWSVTGIEPSEALSTEARERLGSKGEIHCGTLEGAILLPGFDAVTLWDVLEHVPDPRAFLYACRALLRPGGHLFLNVPDLDSLEARLLGRRWPLFLPEHLNYFNRGSLRLCGERAGLTLVRFGRRRASFSVKYVAKRVAQHGIPGSKMLLKLSETPLGRLLIPVSLGETYAVWCSREPAEAPGSERPQSSR